MGKHTYTPKPIATTTEAPEIAAVASTGTEAPKIAESTLVAETAPMVNEPLAAEATELPTESIAVTEHTPPEATVETSDEPPVVVYDEYAGLSTITKTLLDLVDKHIDALNPAKPLSTERGIASQRSFATTLVNIFKLKESKDFIAVMDRLIAKIELHREGSFHDKHAFRHWSAIPLASDRLKDYEYNLSALLTIAKSTDRRQAFKGVDWKLAFSNLDETQRNRLVAYFKRMSGV